MSNIKGIYSASMSLLNDDLTLNIDQTINHAESLIENGCHGTIIFGSTGQAQLLPIEWRCQTPPEQHQEIRHQKSLTERLYK